MADLVAYVKLPACLVTLLNSSFLQLVHYVFFIYNFEEHLEEILIKNLTDESK